MKCVVIYTPFSKKGKFEPFIPKAKKILGQKYEIIDFVKTTKEGHATAIAASCCGVYDLIVVAGGDGLINEVITGVAHKENKPKIAFLPSGTVNDSARSLKVPFNFKKALNVAINGFPFKTDVMKCNNGYAFYVVVLGCVAKSIYSTSSFAKKILGWFAYFFSGLKSFFTPQHLRLKVQIENEPEIDNMFSFVLIYNSRSVAGFGINKDALLDDGNVDIVLIKDHGKGFINYFRNIFKIITFFAFGTKILKNNKHTIVKKVKSIKIQNIAGADYNIDGSYGGDGNIDLNVIKQAVEIMVPMKMKNKTLKHK